MKEALAKALSGPVNLDEQEWERPVDRLHALACASRASHLSSLGVSFLALRVANRPDEYARTLSKLDWFLGRKRRTFSVAMRQAIGRQAVQEMLIQHCPRCQGTGEVPAEAEIEGAQPMKSCPGDQGGCGGTGIRRYSDGERMEALEVDKHTYRGQIEAALQEALDLLGAAETEATRSAKRLLERYS